MRHVVRCSDHSATTGRSFLTDIEGRCGFHLSATLCGTAVRLVRGGGRSSSTLVTDVDNGGSVVTAFTSETVSRDRTVSSCVINGEGRSIGTVISRVVRRRLVTCRSERLRHGCPRFTGLVHRCRSNVLLFTVSGGRV